MKYSMKLQMSMARMRTLTKRELCDMLNGYVWESFGKYLLRNPGHTLTEEGEIHEFDYAFVYDEYGVACGINLKVKEFIFFGNVEPTNGEPVRHHYPLVLAKRNCAQKPLCKQE